MFLAGSKMLDTLLRYNWSIFIPRFGIIKKKNNLKKIFAILYSFLIKISFLFSVIYSFDLMSFEKSGFTAPEIFCCQSKIDLLALQRILTNIFFCLL